MRIRKFMCLILSVVCIGATLVGLTGCRRDKIIVNEQTVNVRLFKGGFGVDWIYELKTKFESAYADQGYKVNILTPGYDMKGNAMLTEMSQGNANTGIDLYITVDIPAQNVGVNGDYGVVAENIKETIWDKPAIGFDGQEESENISSKATRGIEEYTKDDSGTMYGFNWVQSAAGLVVNTRKLAKYGLEMPKTTNELFECFDKIYLGTNGIANSESSKTFPITYVSGTSGYTLCFLNAIMAQYDLEEYNEFWSMQKEVDGELVDMIDDGYKVFSHQGVQEMMTAAYRSFDSRIAAYGSTTQDLDQAQAKIMKDNNDAVFMFNGDWMLNEVKLNYKNQLNDIEFVNFPIISALGTKLFGIETDYNFNDDKCEELLSYIVGLVDENKSITEIVDAVSENKSVTVAVKDVEEIASARGLYYSRGVEHMAYINKNALGKVPAELLLRMMASHDFAEVFAKHSNGTTPYATEQVESDFAFVNQAAAVSLNQYVSVISSKARGFRKTLRQTGIFPTIPHIPSSISGGKVTMFKDGTSIQGVNASVYRDAAIAAQTSERANAESRWSQWKTAAGV